MDFKQFKISSRKGLCEDNLVYNRHGELHSLRLNDLHAWSSPKMDGDYGFYGIPLSDEILKSLGFSQLPNFTVVKSWRIDLGRTRVLTITSCGTGNEMVWLSEEEDNIVNNIIVLRNFDYDGRTFVHHLQNIYTSITGHELNYTP